MKIDGGLRNLFRERIAGDWQSIEAEAMGRGVPDANYCIDGEEGWIEFKKTTGWTVDLRKEQSAWLERRARNGGRVTVAVRQQAPSGSRREARDTLWLLNGADATYWKNAGLSFTSTADTLLIAGGGPAKWDWDSIRTVLRREV